MIPYTNKVNELAIPVSVGPEPHVIGIIGTATYSSGNIRLVQVPQGPAPHVAISGGYTEITSGSPTGMKFIVNYETGVITFNATQNGTSITVSYTGLGSEIAAEDINELQNPLSAIVTQTLTYVSPYTSATATWVLAPGIVTSTSLSGALVVPQANIQPLTLTSSTAVATDVSGHLVSSATTATELGYVHGVTSNIQTQLNNLSAGTITSVVGTTNEITASTVSGAVTLSLPSTVDITTLNLTNPLAVASGGTGLAALTAHDVLVGNGTSNVTLVSPNTAGYVLTSNGTSADPTFQAIPASTGITALTGDVTTSVSPSNPYLGTASTYAVLGETAVTNTGSTVLIGNLGISPHNATSITGFPPGTYSGTENAGNAAAAQALADATSAATTLQAMGPGTDLSSTDLGGHTCVPGVYHTSSTATWSAGNLTLNGAGTYIFLIGSSLTMPANATVVLEGGAIADNVYFVTVSTFTFGANCTVNGTILAGTSITFASNSVLNGRALCYGPSGTTVAFPSAATVTVPPGSGGVEVATLATVNSNVGSFTWTNFTVNAKGLITAASSNPTPVTSIYADSNPLLTGSVQLVSGTNVTLAQVGQVITVNATGGGSGTVSSGTQYQLGYYAATGTTISGLTLISPSKVLVSDTNGLPTASSVTTTTLGYLDATSSIQTQLNSKQASGSYITSLTGDITATGPGSVAATLSTVNSNVGSFTNANITVNAKGLITAASNGSAGGVTGVKTGAGSPETGTITLTAGTNITIVDSPAGTFTINATSGGSGTVNSGTVYQLAYYSATGTAVSGSSILSQDADGLIITSPAPYVRSAASLDILAAADLYLTSGGTIFLYGNVIDAATHKIINLGNGSAAQDAAAFGQITAANAGALALSGGTLTGSLGIGESPVASAVLDVASTTQGFLPPRMATADRDAIASPATGLEIYNTDTNKPEVYNGTAWVPMGGGFPGGSDTQVQYNSGGSFAGTSNISTDGTNLSFDTGSITLTTTGATGPQTSGNILITTSDTTGNALGGNLTLTTGDTSGPSGGSTGGNLTLTTGNGSGVAGVNGGTLSVTTGNSTRNLIHAPNIVLTTGALQSNTARPQLLLSCGDMVQDARGADILLTSGNVSVAGNSSGGGITLTSGTTPSGNNTSGGGITLTSGDSGGGQDAGGSITLTSFTPVNGGNIILTGSGANFGQIGVGTSIPDASASLDITSTTRGFLPPRMTVAQMNAIGTPAAGLMVFTTDTHQWMGWNNSAWVILG